MCASAGVGLGGRDVAARLLEQAYESGSANGSQAKHEVKQATKNTKRDASRAADRLQ